MLCLTLSPACCAAAVRRAGEAVMPHELTFPPRSSPFTFRSDGRHFQDGAAGVLNLPATGKHAISFFAISDFFRSETKPLFACLGDYCSSDLQRKNAIKQFPKPLFAVGNSKRRRI